MTDYHNRHYTMTAEHREVLATAWDEVHSLLDEYDLSALNTVILDTITVSKDGRGFISNDIHGKHDIVVDPRVLDMEKIVSSYTRVESDRPLHFVLLHEVAYLLVWTSQIFIGECEEETCDLFAEKILKEIA